MNHRAVTCAVLIVALGSLSPSYVPNAQSQAWEDPSSHTVLKIAVEQQVELEVLDWGGTGAALVFLAGLNDTAHAFDDFAPRFRDTFRVYGITRRGFGASSRPDSGYDSATRAHDVLAVLDSLGVETAILAGHSIAGDELSRFAIDYPDRVRALIYLDAYSYGRDRTDPEVRQSPWPTQAIPAPMTSADSASVESVIAYLAQRSGVRHVRANILAAVQFRPDGRLERLPAANASVRVLAGTERSDYSRIQAPALAIYAVPGSIEELFPGRQAFDEANRRMAEEYWTSLLKWKEWQIGRSRSGLRRSTVRQISGANHYVHYSHAAEVEQAIRSFLSGLGF
jgi:non-heme chloroperoxidase